MAVATLLPFLLAGTALATGSGVSVQDGWMRMLVASRPAGGYFTLRNATAETRTLTGASSPGCGKLMLHESLHQGGQERMTAVSRLDIPPHGTLRFEPGGYHLMCMQPSPAMHPGGSVPVTLRFADGSTVATDFAVRGATGQ